MQKMCLICRKYGKKCKICSLCKSFLQYAENMCKICSICKQLCKICKNMQKYAKMCTEYAKICKISKTKICNMQKI